MTRKVAIYGTGGHGRDILGTVRDALSAAGIGDELVFVDIGTPSGAIHGVPIVTLRDLSPGDRYILAAGNAGSRVRMEADCEERGLEPFSLFAPTAIVGPGVEIGPGAFLCHNTMITADSRIGRQFQCNIYSYVTHDCVIGDYVTFAPRVSCNGNVHIEDHAYIGAGAVIKQGAPGKPIVIGRGATVGMGAVVTKSVAPGATVMGVPAR